MKGLTFFFLLGRYYPQLDPVRFLPIQATTAAAYDGHKELYTEFMVA